MNRRGQSTLELALAVPFIMGLLVAVLQGGVLISDQVNLEHFAYDGAQWAAAQGGAATPDMVANHIKDEMCGGQHATIPSTSASASRFCKPLPAGVPGFTVTVAGQPVYASAPVQPVAGPTQMVLAASNCKNWQLTSDVSSATAYVNGVGGPPSASFTITMSSVAGGGNKESYAPLSANMGRLAGTAGTPVFNPPVIATGGSYPSRSVLTVTPTSAAASGSYPVQIFGLDQCGRGPSGGSITVTVVVSGGSSVTVTPSAAPNARQTISSATPGTVCQGLSQTITILGTNFVPGATVTIGGTPATTTTYVSGREIDATFTAPRPGLMSVVVSDPTSGVSATLIDAISVLVTCTTPAPSPSVAGPACAGGTAAGSGGVKDVITITYREAMVIPWFSSPSGTPYFTMTATQSAYCGAG